MASPQTALLTVVMMVGVAFLNAADAVIVRTLAGEVHPFIIAFFRALFGLMVMLPWILRRVDMTASPYRGLHVLRAGLKLLSLIALFFAYQRAALPDVTAIVFSLPLFVMLGAWLILGERVDAARLAALGLGLVGMAIVIRPGGQGVDPMLLVALAGAGLMATIQLMLKRMSRHDTPDRLVAWNLASMSILGLLLAAMVWRTPTGWQFILLLAQGALGVLNQALVTRALRMSDASFVGPLDFIRLPAVALLAWLFFDEVATTATWVGAALILSGVLIATRAAHRRGI